jgi:hypothetical protein
MGRKTLKLEDLKNYDVCGRCKKVKPKDKIKYIRSIGKYLCAKCREGI